MKTSLFLSFLWIIVASTSLAQSPYIEGQNSPIFQKAKDAWLMGEDKAALNSLALLSREGNTAAQILLSRIERQPHTYSHFTKNMDRKERIALFRKPGGLSGKSWLSVAAETDALALAYLNSASKEDRLRSLVPLLDYNEAFLAIHSSMPLWREHDYKDVLAEFRSTSKFTPEYAIQMLDTLLYYFEQDEDRNFDDFRWITKQYYALKNLQTARFESGFRVSKRVGNKTELSPEAIENYHLISRWEPLRLLCQKAESKDLAICTVAGANYLNFHNGLLLNSPVPALVTNEEYWASERLALDFARSMKSDRHDYSTLIGQFDSDLVEYMYRVLKE